MEDVVRRAEELVLGDIVMVEMASASRRLRSVYLDIGLDNLTP